MRILAGPGFAETMMLYGELLSRNNSGQVTADEIVQLDFVNSGSVSMLRMTHVTSKRAVWIKPRQDTFSIWFGKEPRQGPHSHLPNPEVDPGVSENFSLKTIRVAEEYLFNGNLPPNAIKGRLAQ